MIDTKINKTLSELETNLRNLESAKNQVEKTVNTYSELESTTSEYVKRLSSINVNLKDIVQTIGQDYKNNIKSFRKDCDDLISKIDKAVDSTQNEISSSIKSFNRKFTFVIIFNIIMYITILVLFFIGK